MSLQDKDMNWVYETQKLFPNQKVRKKQFKISVSWIVSQGKTFLSLQREIWVVKKYEKKERKQNYEK